MQSITKEPDKPDGSTLKEMCLIVQAADAEADMGQYALETGNIVLSRGSINGSHALHRHNHTR